MTESEVKFQLFCRENNLPYQKLKPDDGKTPDYDVYVNGQKVVAEVKEFALNDEEKKALRDLQVNKVATWSGSKHVGDRVRHKIDKAKRQLQQRASGKFPSLLVLYDTRPTPIRGISPYDVLVAMYGFETIDLHEPEKPGEPMKFGKHRFGKGKKLRKDCKAYIGALAILEERADSCLHMNVYINVFAVPTLPLRSLLGFKNISLFTVPPGKGDEFRGWAQVVL